jgi:hypothetical protein
VWLCCSLSLLERTCSNTSTEMAFRRYTLIVTNSSCTTVSKQLRRRAVPSKIVAPSCNQCGDFGGDGFLARSNRCSRSLPIGAYLHSQCSHVHWRSGRWGIASGKYNTPICSSAPKHAFRPGRIRTPRKSPALCAFRRPRNTRAI